MKKLTLLLVMILLGPGICLGQTSAFTYQGKLSDGGTAANGNYDLQFALFDSLSAGAQIGATQTVSTVAVSAGVFKVQLDFGANAFPGANRWLEISARLSGGGSFTTLSPRQPITSTPYAVRSLNASSADSVPVSALPAGNGNYIQNTSSTQVASNFNISGNGTAGGTLTGNVVNANTQYNIGGNRVLRVPGTSTFVGVSAGGNNPGSFNSFFGWSAGATTTGESNAFFGTSAGFYNGAGKDNSFFGAFAGANARFGERNSFFGTQAGGTGDNFGFDNSFFGWFAGTYNTIGYYNTFIGASSGWSNTSENNNTFVGYLSDGATGITNATAVGSRAKVTQSNSLILGSINGVNTATADTFVGIGTTAPARRLHIRGAGSDASGQTDVRITGTGQIASGVTLESTGAGGRTYSWLSTADNLAGGGTGPGRLAAFDVTAGAYRLVIDANGNLGINTLTPQAKLDVNGIIRVATLGSAGATTLCLNASSQVSTCSSSLRYKTNLAPYVSGLSVVNRLGPISFDWKAGGRRDLGFGAEDVEKIDPLLVTYNDQGDVEGVKYDRLGAVLVNAVKEQQAQIEAQQTQLNEQQKLIKKQQAEIEGLKALVCSQHVNAQPCKPKN